MDITGKRVAIVGAGSFGLSTALALVRRAPAPVSVTVVDRSATPGPSQDAASYDLNKIVRSDYAEAQYCSLGLQAMEKWRQPAFQDVYHESGLLMIGLEGKDDLAFLGGAYKLAQDFHASGQLPKPPKEFEDAEALRTVLPDRRALPSGKARGYLNPSSGWVASADATQVMAKQAVELGVDFVSGEVEGIDSSKPVASIKLAGGRALEADLVIVAAGAWAPRILPELHHQHDVVSVGYFVAAVQLSEEEIKRYRNLPVIIRYATGFYVLPPTKTGLVKFSIHGPAFVNPDEQGIGLPRTQSGLGGGKATDTIPKAAAEVLRRELHEILPELAAKEFVYARMCWDSEVPDSDWIIDFLPSAPHKNVLVACGGSGHAFKFTTVLGDLVVARLEDKLSTEQAHSFSAQRKRVMGEKEKAWLGNEWPKRLAQDQPFASKEDLRGSL